MAQSKATKSKSKVNKKSTAQSLKSNKLNIKLIAAVFVVAGLIGGYITYKNIANAAVVYTWLAPQFIDAAPGSVKTKSNGESWWDPDADHNSFVYVASTTTSGWDYCAELRGDSHKVRIEALDSTGKVIGASPYRYPSEWKSATGRSAACLYVTGTTVSGRKIGVRVNRATTSARESLTVRSITREY